MAPIPSLLELVPWDEIFDALSEQLSNPWGIVEVVNETAEELVLVEQAHHDDTGAFHPDFMPHHIVPPFSVERFGTKGDFPTEGPDGHVTYRVGDRDDNVTWRIDWRLNFTGNNQAFAGLNPPNHPDFESLPPTHSTGVRGVKFGYALNGEGDRPVPPGPQPGTDVPTSCIVTVFNQTENPINLIDQGHDLGGFTTTPPVTVDPGESVQFASAETPGAEEGTKGFLLYDLGGGTTWRVEWDNPEQAQNTTSSVIDGPTAASFQALDQVGQGEENVPVTFTLWGTSVEPPPPEEIEWSPPPEEEQPTLRRGDNNPDGWVEYLQDLLNNMQGTSLAVDGDFGPSTEQAVRQLQRDYDIQVDGVVGYQTWALLRGELHSPASTDGLPPHTYQEGGPEARWEVEGFGDYDSSTDSVSMVAYSVGDTPIDQYEATVRVTGNNTGEVRVLAIPLGQPVETFATGGGRYQVVVGEIGAQAGPGVHTVEAYLPGELGGDYTTFQVEVN